MSVENACSYQVPLRTTVNWCYKLQIYILRHWLHKKSDLFAVCAVANINTNEISTKWLVCSPSSIDYLRIVLNLKAPSLRIKQIACVNDDLDKDGIILQVESVALVLQHFLFNKQRTTASDVHRNCRLLEASTRRIWPERVRQVSSVVLLIDQHQSYLLPEWPCQNLVIITL